MCLLQRLLRTHEPFSPSLSDPIVLMDAQDLRTFPGVGHLEIPGQSIMVHPLSPPRSNNYDERTMRRVSQVIEGLALICVLSFFCYQMEPFLKENKSWIAIVLPLYLVTGYTVIRTAESVLYGPNR